MSTFELVVTNQAGDMADVAILIQNPSAGGAGSMCAPGPLAFTVQARLFASGGGACELNGKSAASGAQGGFVGLSVINGSMTGKVLVMCSTGEYQVTLTKK